MTHKYHAGQSVLFAPKMNGEASRGSYKIMRPLPVENDDRRRYRIKSAAEAFERIAEEHDLSRAD